MTTEDLVTQELEVVSAYEAWRGEREEEVPLQARVLLELAQLLSSHSLESSALATLSAQESPSEPLLSSLQSLASATGEYSSLDQAHLLGRLLDRLRAIEKGSGRKKSGSYFTPRRVARRMIEDTLNPLKDAELPQSICDPACGGGAFLLEATDALARRESSTKADNPPPLKARKLAEARAHGIDLSPLAIATCAAALWLYVGDWKAPLGRSERLIVGDALLGRVGPGDPVKLPSGSSQSLHFDAVFPSFFGASLSDASFGFDWIVGNPPWVAFQGRATQKISPELRAFYRKKYRSFTGYPTLQGLFVERASRLAPRGSITLLVPSSLSDLAGYENTRRELTSQHEPLEPLREFGQDAFEGVVQPCFGLIAFPREKGKRSPEPWRLRERSHEAKGASQLTPPSFLSRFRQGERLPSSVFKEMGFQSNRRVSSELFLRAEEGDEKHTLPLLEGRRVSEFSQKTPGLFLNADPQELKSCGVRLRAAENYAKVDFVMRQTAAFTIAAQHHGASFRNSLIAGFAVDGLDRDLLLGLLNSGLYRALHLSGQRDARQATFPQVKLSHLRAPPLPPPGDELRQQVRRIAKAAEEARGLSQEARNALESRVARLFSLSPEEENELRQYLNETAPKAIRPSRS